MLPITADRLATIRRYRNGYQRFPSFFAPKRFTEKIVRKRLTCNPQDEFLVLSADKCAVRQYVADTVGEHILSDVYLMTDNVDEICFDSLTYPCVLKSTHGTNQLKILKSRDSFDENEVKEMCRQWLKTSFPLWYRYMPPKVMAEEFLSDKNESGVDQVPPDYKFFVFAGKVELVVVDVDRFGDHKRSLFNADWDYFDVAYQFGKSGPLPRPKNLEEMLKVAESLSNNLDFVRIDLYSFSDRIVFGEITHSPNAGTMFFDPDDFDFWLGEKWA